MRHLLGARHIVHVSRIRVNKSLHCTCHCTWTRLHHRWSSTDSYESLSPSDTLVLTNRNKERNTVLYQTASKWNLNQNLKSISKCGQVFRVWMTRERQSKHEVNTETRSCNRPCRRKEIFWVSISVSHPAAHAPCYIVICGLSVSCHIYIFLSTLSHKRHDFRGRSSDHTVCVAMFSTTLVRSTSHSENYSAIYCHKFTDYHI